MKRFLVDTNVFLYARGGDHPYRDPCNRILDLVAEGGLVIEASVELVHEAAHVYLRKTGSRPQSLTFATGIAESCQLHAFTEDDLSSTLVLLHAYEQLDFRDAVYAATALNRGIGHIISGDRDFDLVAGLERVDPFDLVV